MGRASPVNYPDREARAGRSYVELAGILVGGYDVLDLLDRLVAHSMELLAADAAGILLGDARGGLRVVAASTDDTALMELLASNADDGPGGECLRSAAQVRVPDVDQVRSRWPEFVVAANRAGAFRSVHALPLRLRGKAVGVLSLFHNTPGLLRGEDLALCQALADVATIGLVAEDAVRRGDVVIERRQTALADRVVIEQATGVIAEQVGLDAHEAYALLRDGSRGRNQSLHEVARQIVARELDPHRHLPSDRDGVPPGPGLPAGAGRRLRVDGPDRAGPRQDEPGATSD